jgi:hypothetical protein
VSPEVACPRARVQLSARLDGEVGDTTARALDLHLASCPRCRAHEQALIRVRRSLRTQPAEPVPDLSEAILQEVARVARAGERRVEAPSDVVGPRPFPHTHRRTRRSGRHTAVSARSPSPGRWAERLRVGGIAAAAAALIMLGASLPFVERPPHLAAAGEIARGVRAAARTLRAYRATFSIVERGWHPAVPVRRMRAGVAFEAPERFRLRVRDHTRYPSGSWPRNDVTIVATARRWSIQEPSSCPTAALPRCATGKESRTIVRRQPFDGTSSLPTDIVVPLETLASSGEFDVLGVDEVLNRSAYRLALPYRRAVPLVMALQDGGLWRSFEPFDRVELWVERRTWFPLRFDVVRGDRPPLLSVRATSFSARPVRAPGTFTVPVRGLIKDGGFQPARRMRSRQPRFLAGLAPYRRGVLAGGGEVRSYVRGMTWLKVTYDDATERAFPLTAEEVRLARGRVAYYQPATGTGTEEALRRRVDVFGRGAHVHLEANLARDELLRVAASLPVAGRRLDAASRRGGTSVRRLAPEAAARFGFVASPGSLPRGYAPTAALLTRSRDGRRTVTVYYRRPEAEFDGFGIRITQARPVTMLPPTSESLHSLRVGERRVRWSEERGEAEWRDGLTYRAVAAPSFGWPTAARIIEGLR